jgi:hypothetical protein
MQCPILRWAFLVRRCMCVRKLFLKSRYGVSFAEVGQEVRERTWRFFRPLSQTGDVLDSTALIKMNQRLEVDRVRQLNKGLVRY